MKGRPHVCGPECEPGWRLRDIVEFGAVFGLPATQAVIEWDKMHKRDPATPRYDPKKEGVTYGT